MEEYIEAFELVSSQVQLLPKDKHLGYFLGGLQSEIKCQIHIFRPQSHIKAMQLVKDIEESWFNCR